MDQTNIGKGMWWGFGEFFTYLLNFVSMYNDN